MVSTAQMGARVLNNSWGGDFIEEIGDAFRIAYQLNRTSVAGLGTTFFGRTTIWPANFDGVIAVGAIDINGIKSPFSPSNVRIDVCAPGGTGISQAIPSDDSTDILSTLPGNSYGLLYGTSMATPHVTGVAALLLSRYPNLANDDVENIVKFSADDFINYGPGWDKFTGYGLVNARRALELLQSPNVLIREDGLRGAYPFGPPVPFPYLDSAVWFSGIPGLPSGSGGYDARRHEYRRDVTFPRPFYSTPSPLSSNLYPWPAAWGRGLTSNGYAGGDSKYIGVPFCEVVPGTLDSAGCVLRFYVWELLDAFGGTLGFFPDVENPLNLVFAYSVLGEPVFTAPTLSLSYNGVQVNLGIAENNLNEDGMAVERKDATTNAWQTIATLPPNATAFTDTSSLKGSETYSYRIKAFNIRRQAFSNERTVTAKPKPPGNFTAEVVYVPAGGSGFSMLAIPDPGGEQVPSNKVQVRWTAPANQKVAIDSYRVEAYYFKERVVACPCVGCLAQSGLWPTFERAQKTTGSIDTFCLDIQDTLYDFYVKSFVSLPSGAKDSSIIWIGQTCPPESTLVGPKATARTGTECACGHCLFDPGFKGTSSAVENNLPKEFALGQNYPNPFNPTTTIRYALPQATKVELKIYNVLGQVVRKLVDEEQAAGFYEKLWDGKDQNGRPVSTGIYLYQIRAGDFVQSKKMQLMK